MSSPLTMHAILEAVRHDARHAWRTIRGAPAFALAVTLILAVGVGVDATMFGILDRLLFRAPDGVTEPDRVFLLETHKRGAPWYNSSFSYAAYTDYRDHANGFEQVGIVTGGGADGHYFPLGRGTAATRVAGALASATFFQALGVRPALGRFYGPDEDDANRPQNVAVISYGFWQSHFGGARSAVGATVDIGTQRYRVIGVAPKGFNGVDLSRTDVWLPVTANSGLRFDKSEHWTTNRHAQWARIVVRVKRGVSPVVAAEQATAVLRGALRQQMLDDPRSARWIQPDSESVLLASLVPGRVPPDQAVTVNAGDVKVAKLVGFMAVVFLLIACANVSNLMLVRAIRRRREIALRLALGISRGRLLVQLLTEGVILSVLGGVGAVVLTRVVAGPVRGWLLGDAAFSGDAVDARVLAFTTMVAIAAGVATSLAPALQSARTDLVTALKSGARDGTHRSRLREALVVVQAALALVLLAGAALFVRSVRNVRALPFGIDVDHAVVASFSHRSVGMSNADAERLYRDMAERIQAIPGIRAAAVTVALPFAMSWGVDVHVPGRTLPKLRDEQAVQYAITPGYFAALGIPLRGGRAFTAADARGAAPVAIINRTMAQLYWPSMNPLGQCAKIGDDTMSCTTIVGVVENTRRQSLVEGLVPQIYRPLDQMAASDIDGTVSFFGYFLVVGTSGDASAYVDRIRRTMMAASGSVPYPEVRPMADLLGRRMRAWQLGARVFTSFGVLALLLAAVGLFAVTAFTVTQRLHDFGIRVALGARPADVLRVALTTSLRPVLTGLFVGTALALVAGRLVESMLFGISARDPATLATVCGVMLVASTLAALLPAARATLVDPAAVLRAE